MFKVGFDNDAYLKTQSEKIQERISKFGGKLYLEFGGKLFDDHHASRVLPGFAPDSKIRMLEKLKDKAEVIIAINSQAIEDMKVRFPRLWPLCEQCGADPLARTAERSRLSEKARRPRTQGLSPLSDCRLSEQHPARGER